MFRISRTFPVYNMKTTKRLFSEVVSKTLSIPVKAYYVDNKIDIPRVHQIFSTKKIDIQKKVTTITVNEVSEQFISVFKYGSVVFFNIPESEHNAYISQIRSTNDTRKVPLQHTEEFKVINISLLLNI